MTSGWRSTRFAGGVERVRVGVGPLPAAGAVGDSMGLTADGAPVRLGEFTRVLGELEARERATVTRLAEITARLGIDIGCEPPPRPARRLSGIDSR